MRILIATRYRGIVGGTEKYLQALIPGLRGRNHSLGLLYEDAYSGEQCIEGAQQLSAWCSTERGIEAVLRAVVEWQPDIAYVHGLNDPLLERALLERYPAILFVHTYRGTCVSTSKCFTLPRAQPCTRLFGKGCLALYYPRRCGGLNPVTMLESFRRQTEQRALFPKYRAILVASRHMLGELQLHGATNVRLIRLPAGNSPDPIPPRQRVPQGRLLFMGRLGYLKGIEHLIRAIPQAQKSLTTALSICIVGDGADRAKLEKLAKQLRVRAVFTGWLNDKEKITLMRESDLLLVPSLWPEPFGLVGIEAGCVGLPAVGYDVGGIPDWVVPGESGELAPGNPPTVAGLAQAIVRSLADPKHYNKLCAGAWQIAKQFTLEGHLNQLESMFEETLARPNAAYCDQGAPVSR